MRTSLGSNKDNLMVNCLFESTVDATAAESSSMDSYVDVEGNEVIATRILFASCDSLISANIARHFLLVL